MPLSEEPPDYLRRLSDGWYTGHSWVHWTMTMDRRAKGWLNDRAHAVIRETLLHTLARHGMVCPAYCLMPDHAHFLWLGVSASCDQKAAASFFRRHWNRDLKAQGFALQKQAYEHVLNEHERNQTEFEDTLLYILKNPQRAGLCGDWREWPFCGMMAAGYPDLDPRVEDGLGRFWKVYAAEMTRRDGGGEASQTS